MSPLYLDNHILVLNKSKGVLTLPSVHETDCLVEHGKAFLKEKFQKPGNVFLHPVHRLDRGASGIVVFARTSKALSRLNESIREGDWKKIYLLQCEGRLPQKEGEIISYLNRCEYHTEVVKEGEGKRCMLRYRSLENGLVEVELLTGRYHQIRAQFASIGCPIKGDTKYGAKSAPYQGGIALHHARLTFTHPVTKELLTIEAD
ncbi:MAG: RluA family pseudouridine synthase [Verrucomicrobia bacterium]|nr:RluA family pseudouridine synthase [Verrucomicrobiota bacterium]